jgi:hypothetical protein
MTVFDMGVLICGELCSHLGGDGGEINLVGRAGRSFCAVIGKSKGAVSPSFAGFTGHCATNHSENWSDHGSAPASAGTARGKTDVSCFFIISAAGKRQTHCAR